MEDKTESVKTAVKTGAQKSFKQGTKPWEKKDDEAHGKPEVKVIVTELVIIPFQFFSFFLTFVCTEGCKCISTSFYRSYGTCRGTRDRSDRRETCTAGRRRWRREFGKES